jgi:hypothetical protein
LPSGFCALDFVPIRRFTAFVKTARLFASALGQQAVEDLAAIALATPR